MHARFGTQQAKGIVAFYLECGTADASHVTLGLFHHLDLETLALAILEVLAQEHRRPVARFRAARSGLNVDKTIAGVGRVVEHAAELHLFHRGAQGVGIGLDGRDAADIAFGFGHVVQLDVV